MPRGYVIVFTNRETDEASSFVDVLSTAASGRKGTVVYFNPLSSSLTKTAMNRPHYDVEESDSFTLHSSFPKFHNVGNF